MKILSTPSQRPIGKGHWFFAPFFSESEFHEYRYTYTKRTSRSLAMARGCSDTSSLSPGLQAKLCYNTARRNRRSFHSHCTRPALHASSFLSFSPLPQLSRFMYIKPYTSSVLILSISFPSGYIPTTFLSTPCSIFQPCRWRIEAKHFPLTTKVIKLLTISNYTARISLASRNFRYLFSLAKVYIYKPTIRQF